MDKCSSKTADESKVDIVSLGMVVIDEIRLPSRPPLIDIAGGSGAYASLGSRLFAPSSHSRRVGCLVLAGSDFPDEVRDQLVRWQMTLQFNISRDKLSTRGILVYEDDTFGSKKFRYTTTPLRASPCDLMNTALLSSRAFHMLATPEEIEIQVPELNKLRQECGIEAPPFIVWEPFPSACTTQNTNAFLQACRLVNVFSPNHLEISALCDDCPSGHFEPAKVENHARKFCKAVGSGSKGVVVVRAGEHGSLTSQFQDVIQSVWLPPYYQLGATKVVDPTGAGNTFLGGFMQGWLSSQDMKEASTYGNVAASFAIEQIGLPQCEKVGEEELWNGVNVRDRLEEYKARMQSSIID